MSKERKKIEKEKLRETKNKNLLRAKKDIERKTKKLINEQFVSNKIQRQIDGTNNSRQFFNIHKNLPGRNEKCFCGSDKKFKTCCLPKVQEEISNKRVQIALEQ